jgi:DNA-binding CsgD family transcriptional regulator
MKNERIFKYNLVLQPEHPFTRRQGEIIEAIIEGATAYKEIAQRLGLKRITIRNEICGVDFKPGIPRSSAGVFGVTRDVFGKRPESLSDLIWILLENGVLTLEENRQFWTFNEEPINRLPTFSVE